MANQLAVNLYPAGYPGGSAGPVVEINRTKAGHGWRIYPLTAASWHRLMYVLDKHWGGAFFSPSCVRLTSEQPAPGKVWRLYMSVEAD